MSVRSSTSSPASHVTTERLQRLWAELNARYFQRALPSIEIAWSRRLTASAGMFVSRVGPRDRIDHSSGRREIRLSLPLLPHLSDGNATIEQDILNTLAHEMIHQWQFDVLKRRPDHGRTFLRKMTEMNRSGLVGITLYHSLGQAVQTLISYAWRCRQCGHVYRRRRRSIHPHRHRCGACHGPLGEVLNAQDNSTKAKGNHESWVDAENMSSIEQLAFSFTI
ncbi:MAG: SprT-like domain-containing protein [Nitrospiraceae bacterium]